MREHQAPRARDDDDRAAACLFAEEGARIVVADIDSGAARDAVAQVREAGGEAMYTVGDVGLASDAERMVADGLEAFGKVDILINNAAVVQPIGPTVTAMPVAWAAAFAVNVDAPFHFTRRSCLRCSTGAGVGS